MQLAKSIRSFTPPPVGIDKDVFIPGGYIVGLVESIIAADVNMRIALPGLGDITVFPSLSDCVLAVEEGDLARFLSATRDEYLVTPAARVENRPQRHMRLEDLLWLAGYTASRGRMVANGSLLDVVRLSRWPNFSRLPRSLDSMRMVALLTRHPTSIALALRILGMSVEEGCRVYSAATCAGLVEVCNRRAAVDGVLAREAEEQSSDDAFGGFAQPQGPADDPPAPVDATGNARRRRDGLLGQLLSRIMGL